MKEIDSSKIVRVLDEIAFQTNLLALNAAIEVPLAEAGAVVAEEGEAQSLFALVERMRKQVGPCKVDDEVSRKLQ